MREMRGITEVGGGVGDPPGAMSRRERRSLSMCSKANDFLLCVLPEYVAWQSLLSMACWPWG